ncbi:MAG: Ppx/GppA family phosphatase [Actinobacteria bacterium]|jgi:exopolyphosphatase/guanosine-5'-triphosphate,3'-diphosphate pyrophosphatase|nr:MAG: Ppx/GppA family phosphatase [Actinomycetota bacterium]
MTKVRVAGIDIGTNSVRMLSAEVTWAAGFPRVRTLHRLMRITRLGQGVDERGYLSGSAVERTAAVLREYRDLMREEDVEAVEVAATSAARDAANAGDFMRLVAEIVGSRPRTLSGQEEARLSFLGATYDLGPLLPQGDAVLVVDIGGGSTELVVGRDGDILEEISLDVGCVRMSERFLGHDPPLQRELADMEEYVRKVLAPSTGRISRWTPRLMVGLAGTITTLSGLELGLQRYDGDAVHHSWLTLEGVEGWYSRLSALSLAERKDLMRLEPGRADIIVGGTGVILTLLRELGWGRFLVSEKDILDGLAISAAGEARG